MLNYNKFLTRKLKIRQISEKNCNSLLQFNKFSPKVSIHSNLLTHTLISTHPIPILIKNFFIYFSTIPSWLFHVRTPFCPKKTFFQHHLDLNSRPFSFLLLFYESQKREKEENNINFYNPCAIAFDGRFYFILLSFDFFSLLRKELSLKEDGFIF